MKKMAVIFFAIAFSFINLDFVSARVVNNYFYASLEIVNDKIEQEKTFDVNLNIKAHFNLKGVEGDLSFDNTKLELVGVDCNPEFTCLNNVRFVADKIDGLSGEYTLATFHFKVADDFDMENGDRIRFSDIEGANSVISEDTYVDVGIYVELAPEPEEDNLKDDENGQINVPDTGENQKEDGAMVAIFMYISAGVAILSFVLLVGLVYKRDKIKR